MPQIQKRMKRICIRLWEDDWEKLVQVSSTSGDTGFNHLVREIVHSYVTHLKDKERAKHDKISLQIPIDLSELNLEIDAEVTVTANAK